MEIRVRFVHARLGNGAGNSCMSGAILFCSNIQILEGVETRMINFTKQEKYLACQLQ